MKNFLIVDDDSDDRDFFCEALGEVMPNSSCYTAINGRGALKALENKEIELPDLIFLDINMPIMNGWQLLTKLKETESYGTIPVIIYSTSSYPEDVEKAKRLGALCFLSKPTDYFDLKQALFVIIDHLDKGTIDTLSNSSSLFIVCNE